MKHDDLQQQLREAAPSLLVALVQCVPHLEYVIEQVEQDHHHDPAEEKEEDLRNLRQELEDINTILSLAGYSQSADNTEYAKSIGYTGRRPVLVFDGKVVSHQNVDWFQFCDECRSGKR